MGGGAPTPEAAMFRKICMLKQKNLDPWGGGGRAPAAPPWIPPMHMSNCCVQKVYILCPKKSDCEDF